MADGKKTKEYQNNTVKTSQRCLHLEHCNQRCLHLNDSEKTGKITSAAMYFLHFQVYRINSTVNALAMAQDPGNAFFKRLDGLQPCEVSELKPGTHIFAVYGDNFFKPATYTIEDMCAKSFEDATEKLKGKEAQILAKRNDLRQFQIEYRKVGDKVKKGQVICIIEAMKLMNEIEADQDGTVVDVIAEDGEPVSVDSPLLVIEP